MSTRAVQRCALWAPSEQDRAGAAAGTGDCRRWRCLRRVLLAGGAGHLRPGHRGHIGGVPSRDTGHGDPNNLRLRIRRERKHGSPIWKRLWDDAKDRPRPMDGTAWAYLDEKIDEALKAVRAATPDPTAEKQALDALLTALR